MEPRRGGGAGAALVTSMVLVGTVVEAVDGGRVTLCVIDSRMRTVLPTFGTTPEALELCDGFPETAEHSDESSFRQWARGYVLGLSTLPVVAAEWTVAKEESCVVNG